jgi:hypothetical protein
MTPEEHGRLYELIQIRVRGARSRPRKNPGVDLTLTQRNLTLSPHERVKEMEQALRFAEDLQYAVHPAKNDQL